MILDKLIKTGKKLTHDEKCQYFINPTSELLNNLLNLNNPNVLNDCINAILDYNPDLTKFKDFFRNPKIKSLLGNKLKKL